ncbi:MAG: Bax inhibitor-1/YccA family protein [Parvibaculaceae bacterium]|nr:Bax inhibitor-1/YccA family protein [Parvibaculaceae bacterium]
MSDYNSQDLRARAAEARGQAGVDIDQGLRSYMLGVYNYMAGALVITGLAAYALFSAAFVESAQGLQLTSLGTSIYNSPIQYVLMFAPLAFVLVLSFGINKLSASATQMLFWAFSAIMGLSLSYIFAVYQLGSITQVFLITAIAFGGLSLYGYTTKRDLSAMGAFMVMGLIGIIVASLVNLFLQSSALQFAISVIGVLVFAGLTAWDTQKIKSMYNAAEDSATRTKKSVMGALTLYLDFINMFLFLLRLFGDRR